MIVLYLTSVKIKINDKTNYKSNSLQLGLFMPNECKILAINYKYPIAFWITHNLCVA